MKRYKLPEDLIPNNVPGRVGLVCVTQEVVNTTTLTPAIEVIVPAGEWGDGDAVVIDAFTLIKNASGGASTLRHDLEIGGQLQAIVASTSIADGSVLANPRRWNLVRVGDKIYHDGTVPGISAMAGTPMDYPMIEYMEGAADPFDFTEQISIILHAKWSVAGETISYNPSSVSAVRIGATD